ncbi:SGNH/GDSL hydrolase family protein [Vreelandella piezotolerans]|uniref:SGNH/GDSL hydrolase family protein n=1 Tax=Vreelandella piezotolerans TaxID=2609667 RepID=UPI00379D1D60
MNRVIRLKEWGSSVSTHKQPSEEQLLKATKSLANKRYALNTDENGFIINSKVINRSSRSKKIVLLGDSFVESVFVDEEKRINAVIEGYNSSLNVLNGGYSGATSLHVANVLLNKVVPVEPSLVVFFMPTNDQRVIQLDDGYWNIDQRLSPLVPLGKEKVLLSDYSGQVSLKSMHKMLKVIHSILCIYDIPFVFASTPHRFVKDENDEWLLKVGANIEKYNRKSKSRSNVNKICKNYCANNLIDFIDLEGAVSEKADFFYDDLHLTSDASILVGNILIDELKLLGLLY